MTPQGIIMHAIEKVVARVAFRLRVARNRCMVPLVGAALTMRGGRRGAGNDQYCGHAESQAAPASSSTRTWRPKEREAGP